ncbi:MAG: glycoside hydrolase family 43 protein [Maricaulaceae bacterium]
MRGLFLIAAGLGVWTLLPDAPKPAPVSEPPRFANPIIPGFAPDPSIVRVDDDFYLVNSSFEYFPALPIRHSTDLINWRLIGHAISDPAHGVAVGLDAVESSGGVHAATIRYDAGRFYVVSTVVVDGAPTSFIVTAENPAGPWSAPVIVEDAIGIDPSLFFDDDGRVWYTANAVAENPELPGQALIWLQELDRDTLQLKGERRFVWSGCCQGVWAEGPHLYKREGTYYLLLSEGGTSYEHAVSVAASDTVTGPYVGNSRNPILTHRHLSFDHPITGGGHADLVELADGRWYGVALGWRLINEAYGLLGRETFLFPVVWETEREGWKDPKATFPVASPLSGKIEPNYPLPFKARPSARPGGFVDGFNRSRLDLRWTARRAHPTPFHRLTEPPGQLVLNLQSASLAEGARYSFLGVRQTAFAFEADTLMTFSPATADEEAGLSVMMNDRAALTLTRRQIEDKAYVVLSKWLYGERITLAQTPVSKGPLQLRVEGDGAEFQVSVIGRSGYRQSGGEGIDGRFLAPNTLDGFNYTGLYVGLYASANGAATQTQALFDRFAYTERPTD